MPKSLFLNSAPPLMRLFIASAMALTVSAHAMAVSSPQSSTPSASDVAGKTKDSGDYGKTCNPNEAMVASTRHGDENSDPVITCSSYAPYGVAGTMSNYKIPEPERQDDIYGNWSSALNEGNPDGHTYTCPVGTLMTGIKHTGDENGSTYYRCSAFSINGVVQQLRGGIVLKFPEDDHEKTCPAGQVMIGRSHLCDNGDKCDENASSTYTCGYVRAL